MTTTASRSDAAPAVTPDLADARPSATRPLTSSWYDPDGAGWDAGSANAFESFRATPPPPRIELLGDEDGGL